MSLNVRDVNGFKCHIQSEAYKATRLCEMAKEYGGTLMHEYWVKFPRVGLLLKKKTR